MSDFPHSRIVSMAIIETIQFGVLFISAAGVTPTMTLILMHANTVSNFLLTRFIYPAREFTTWQIRGLWLIMAAILCSLARPMINLITGWRETEATCSLLYIGAACILGWSNLYKEYSVTSWKEPMDIHFLTSWLYIYQLLFSVLAAPLFFYFQNVSVIYESVPVDNNLLDGYNMSATTAANHKYEHYSHVPAFSSAYPLSELTNNINDGLQCVLQGTQPEWIEHYRNHSYVSGGYGAGMEHVSAFMNELLPTVALGFTALYDVVISWLGLGYEGQHGSDIRTSIYQENAMSHHNETFPYQSNENDYVPDIHSVFIVSKYSYNTDILCSFCNCHNGFYLILLFICSNIIVSECISKVLESGGTHILDRSLVISILTAFIALGVYDTKLIEDNMDNTPYGGLLFGTSIGYADIISIIVLVIGIDIHGRDVENEDLIDAEALNNDAHKNGYGAQGVHTPYMEHSSKHHHFGSNSKHMDGVDENVHTHHHEFELASSSIDRHANDRKNNTSGLPSMQQMLQQGKPLNWS